MTHPRPADGDYCTAELPDRELGCDLLDGHPPPHRDADGTEFTTDDQRPVDLDDVIAAHPELPLELTAGLTVWGDFLSAQLRLETTLAGNDDGTFALDDDGNLIPGPTLTTLVVAIRDETPVSSEDGNPYRLPAADARRLRDLLNIATARGVL